MIVDTGTPDYVMVGMYNKKQVIWHSFTKPLDTVPLKRQTNLPPILCITCSSISNVVHNYINSIMILILTSVVMTMHEAVGFIVVSPVINPTSLNSSYISLYF